MLPINRAIAEELIRRYVNEVRGANGLVAVPGITYEGQTRNGNLFQAVDDYDTGSMMRPVYGQGGSPRAAHEELLQEIEALRAEQAAADALRRRDYTAGAGPSYIPF